jgi:dTDP-L-rhamnose 4-epimerase
LADTILITGGAGFIGRHLARALLAGGHRVRVLDSLIEQVHGARGRPDELDPDVELAVGDVRD